VGASERLRDDLQAVMPGGGGPVGSADRLCHACVDLLRVDAAAISFVADGESRGTFGSSGPLSRRWDEFQFTFGEGPCLDAVSQGRPVVAEDLADPWERRWPAFAGAMLNDGVRAVFALPVRVAASRVGALDLFRRTAGSFDDDLRDGAEWASQLAALPLLDLMSADVDWDAVGQGDGWSQLASLERVEVYQATGMIQVQLDVDAAEALVRLRGYAFAHDLTASEVAWRIIERRLSLKPEDSQGESDPPGSPR
jgi:GAF domain